MRTKIILILIFILFFAGLVAYGYSRAVPGLKDAQEAHPAIEIESSDFDFGEIAYGDIFTHDFKVKNMGDAELKITRIATSCACTSAKIDKDILAPGEEATLSVRYESGMMSGDHAKGEQERIIYVKSSDPVHPQVEATIKGYVK
jgi:Protein of unknown function (DUF1573)